MARRFLKLFENFHPQVIFQFHDAYTGDLRYSETYVLGMD